jgi:hypothetical protein
VSYDRPDVLQAFAERHRIGYPLLSDAGSATIRTWGLLNAAATGREAGIPHPGTLLIGRDGQVIERAFEANYRERSSGTSILARLGVRVEAAGATRAVGKQIAVVTGTSETDAPPGRRLTLIADVTPAPRMHVYAPGQQGYIPIAITLDESPDVRPAPPRFPAPGTYFFAPLNETVKVYAAPFRISQEVTLGLSRDLRQRATARETLTITGKLDYQACDDAVCYRPDTIPLRWTVRLLPYQR